MHHDTPTNQPRPIPRWWIDHLAQAAPQRNYLRETEKTFSVLVKADKWYRENVEKKVGN